MYGKCLSCPISPLKPHFSAIIFICGLQEMLLYMLHWSRDPLSFKILILTCLSAQSFLPFCEWSSSTIWEHQLRDSCHIFSNAKDFLSLSSVFHSTAVCVWSITASSNSVEDFSDVFGCVLVCLSCVSYAVLQTKK